MIFDIILCIKTRNMLNDIKNMIMFISKTTKKTLMYSFANFLLFFVKLMLYKNLYSLLTYYDLSNNDNLVEFYRNIIYNLFSIICFEIVICLTYYYVKIEINKIITNMISKYESALLNFPLLELSKHIDNEKIQQLSESFYAFELMYDKLLIDLPKTLIYICYYFYSVFNFSIYAVSLMVLIGIISTFIFHIVMSISDENYDHLLVLDSDMKEKTIERLNNLKYIKASCTELYEKQNIFNINNHKHILKNNDVMISNLINLIQNSTKIIVLCSMYIMGGSYVGLHMMKPIDLFFLGSSSEYFINNVINLRSFYSDYKKYNNEIHSILRFNKLTVYDFEKSYVSKIQKYSKLKFIYKNTKYFTIEQGKITLLTGRNGCGKTSMINSLLGLTTFDTKWKLQGSFNTDLNSTDDNWEDIDYIAARKLVSFVTQEPYMFNKTIIENILYGTNATMDDVHRMMKKTGITIDDTQKIIEKNGENVSGGEKKKIQLLNTILSNKYVYIFDEPTNNLDSITYDLFVNFIKQISLEKDKLIIVISHDDALIDIADVNIELAHNLVIS